MPGVGLLGATALAATVTPVRTNLEKLGITWATFCHFADIPDTFVQTKHRRHH